MLQTDVENFIPEPNSGCWIFMGPLNGKGHGVIYNDSAQRRAYKKWKGSIPPAMEVHHKCGVKCCVNPDHLQLLTKSEHKLLHKERKLDGVCKHGHDLRVHGVKYSAPQTKRGFTVGCRECKRQKSLRSYHQLKDVPYNHYPRSK